ncbi:MAG: exodeoxyribonuclease VII small subunit [Candidatus Cryptobacteroides sp.]
MTNEDYKVKVARLKELEAMVKDPELSLDKVDGILKESEKLVKECRNYLRGVEEKLDELADINK